MKKLNTAQRFYGGLMDLPNHPDASLTIAAEQTRLGAFAYRSHMANGPTPPRLVQGGKKKPKLFKGHRV